MKKVSWFQRSLALTMCLVMLTGILPAGTPKAAAAQVETACDHSSLIWTEIPANTKLPVATLTGGGHFKLTGDVKLAGTVKVDAGVSIHLDLNGYTMTCGGSMFNLVGSASGTAQLTICDSSMAQTGTLDANGNNARGVLMNGYSQLNIYGGTFTGLKSTGTSNGMVAVNASTAVFNFYGGTITGNENVNGGGVSLYSGTMNMYGGTISNNTATSHGGGIYANGSLNIYGGSVSGNTAGSHGGGVYFAKGSLTMTAGEIADNAAGASGSGGGLMVQGGTVKMSGGKVSGNEASTGGAIYINNIGTSVTMSGTAQLSGNKAVTHGGAVYCANGSFTMENGMVSDNEAAQRGGALYGENLLVKNGTVSGNKAQTGGAVYHNGDEPVEIAGGEFKNNSATDNGAIGYSNGNATLPEFRISGGTFTGNTTAGDNSFLLSGMTFVMTGGTVSGNTKDDGTALTLRLHNYNNASSGLFTDTPVVEDGGVFCSAVNSSSGTPAVQATVQKLKEGAKILSQSALLYDMDDYTVQMGKEGNLNLYAYNPEVPSEHASNWAKLSGEISTLEAGTYVLEADTVLTKTITLSGSVSICLDNKTLSGKAAPFFKIGEGASLTICDCSRDKGGLVDGDSFSGVSGGFAQVSGGSFTLNSGTISGFETDGSGGVLYVTEATAEVTLAGGAITGNKAGKGGAVRIDKGTLRISGTDFRGNEADNGAVIFANGSGEDTILEITGGEFTENKASVGGVIHSNGAAITLSGGSFTDNQSKSPVFALQATELLMSGGVIRSNFNYDGTAAAEAISLGNHFSSGAVSSGVFTGTAVVQDGGVSVSGTGTAAEVKQLQTGAIIMAATALTVPAGDKTVRTVSGAGTMVGYVHEDGQTSVHTDSKLLAGVVSGITAGTFCLADDAHLSEVQTLTGAVTLCLNGHTLTGSAAPYFKVPKDTSLTICDCSEAGTGTMDGSTAKDSTSRGLIYAYGTGAANGGTITMTGGTITGHKTTGYGGAFSLTNNASLTVTGGRITGNETSNHGGAIHANGTGKIRLSNCEISDNVGNAGTLITYGNPVEIGEGVTFTGNVSNGGSILQINKGTLTMTAGEVSGNSSKSATVLASGATFTMSGGSVVNNYQLDGKSSAVAVLASANGTTGGTAILTGNAIVGGSGVNYSGTGSTATVKALEPGAMICGYKALTVGDDTVGTSGSWYLYAKDIPEDHPGFAPLQGEVTAISAGNYFLVGDVELSGTMVISGSVTLCLNGYNVTGVTAPYFNVAARGSKLTICDHSEYADGKLDGSVLKDSSASGLVRLGGGAEFTLQSGGICGHRTAGNGAAIFALLDATVNIKGGFIRDHYSATGNGTIFAYSSTKDQITKVNVSGGEISNNETCLGGAFFLNLAELNISGGVIKGNTGSQGASVCYGNSGFVTVTGGTMTENKIKPNTTGTPQDAVLLLCGGTFAMNGGTISGNIGPYGTEGIAVLLSEHSTYGFCEGAVSGSAVIEDAGIAFKGDGNTCTVGALSRSGSKVISAVELDVMEDGTVYTTPDTVTGRYIYTGSALTPYHPQWTALEGTVTAESLTEGGYYLTADAGLSDTVTVSGDVELCLNGFVLGGNFLVPEGSSLTVCDHSQLSDGVLKGSGTDVPVLVQGGTFRLQSGGVINGTSSVQVTDAGAFQMGGGFLSGCETAILAEPYAEISISGGSIYGNTVSALQAQDAHVTISGGVFRDHQGTDCVIGVEGGSLTVSGGFFKENTVETAVIHVQGAALTMTGGTVRNNNGAVALLLESGSGTISGSAVLEDEGLRLSDNGLLTIQKLTSGASIYAPADRNGLTVTESDTLLITELENGLICYSYKYEKSTSHTGWRPIRGILTDLSSGSYYLTDHAETSGLVITGQVELCLNGKTLTGAKAPFVVVESGGSLTVCDHGVSNSGAVVGSHLKDSTANGLLYVKTGGTLVWLGGSIYGHETEKLGAAVYNAGTFRMEGGRIHTGKAKKGGAIAAVGTKEQYAEVTLTGGTIDGNYVTEGGSAIYTKYADIFVSGGLIAGNEAKVGQTIVAETSTFNMTGGRIEDNVNSSDKLISAVYLSTGSVGMLSEDAVVLDKGVKLYDGSSARVAELSDTGMVYSTGAIGYDAETVARVEDLEHGIFVHSKKNPERNGVTITADGVTIEEHSLSLGQEWVKKSQQLTATLDDGITVPGKKLNWYSSNTSVATVNASGKVTYRGLGTTVITVRVLDEYDQDTGYFDTLTITLGDTPLKVLAIGNSSTRDALMYLSDLALLTGNRIELGIVSRTSASIRDHAYYMSLNGGNYSFYKTNADTGDMTCISDGSTTVQAVLRNEDWDVVILQHGQYTLGYSSTYTQDVDYLTDYIHDREPGAAVYWNMGWALEDSCDNTTFVDSYGTRNAMYNAIVRCIREFIAGDEGYFAENFDGYAPTGAAIEHLRGMVSYKLTRNDIDLSYEGGRLTAAMTMLKTILPETDLSLITISGLAGILSEYDAALGKYAPDAYENTEENLNKVKAAVEAAILDATTGDMVPDLVEQKQWVTSTVEGEITVAQSYAPNKLHFCDVAISQEDGSIYVCAYEGVQHAVIGYGSGTMQEGSGRVFIWKGTPDGQNFDTENPLLTINERTVEQWGLYPQLFNRYERINGAAASVIYKQEVNVDPRDPNLVMVRFDTDGDGTKEEVLLFTVWMRCYSNDSTARGVTLYAMHSVDGGATWTDPQPLNKSSGTGVAKRGDITYFDNGEILVPYYGSMVGALHLAWNTVTQQWELLGDYEIPDTSPEESDDGGFGEVSLISPKGDDTVYAYVRLSGAMLKSEDRGKTWVEISNEPGRVQQPGFALLDEDHVFTTWSTHPKPRKTWGKVFNFSAAWEDYSTNLIYDSSLQNDQDAADPSCALMADGKVFVVQYDTAFRAVIGKIVDPYDETYVPYEIAEDSVPVTFAEGEGSGDAAELGQCRRDSHSVLVTAVFTEEDQSLEIETRNGIAVVTPDSLTFGEEAKALALALDTETTIRISLVGRDVYLRVWQEQEPDGWTMETVGDMEGEETRVTASGADIEEARVVKFVDFRLPETMTVQAYGAVTEMDYTADPIADQVIWTSADPSVAEVDGGKICGLKPGETEITAQLGDVILRCQLTVEAPPREINPNYERSVLMEDDFQKYEAGLDSFWEYHWDNVSDSKYLFNRAEDAKPDSILYKICQDGEEKYLGLTGSTWHMTKQKFEGDYTVQFDFCFTADDETINITLWQADTGKQAVSHAFVNMRSSGVRFQYRPLSPQDYPDTKDNPNYYGPDPAASYPLCKDKLERGKWMTVKMARTDGALYLKIWDRGEQEPVNWDGALFHEVLNTSEANHFRLSYSAKTGSFNMDNLVISQATEVLAETPDEPDVPDEPEDPEIELFDGFLSRMVLGNALELQVGIPQDAMEDWTGTYAKVTFKDETTTIPYEEWTAVGPYYALTVSTAAKEMNEDVKVQIFNSDDQAVSVEYTDSIRKYAERNYEGAKDEVRTMLVDMLNYGAAAQEYLDYNTDSLANEGLTQEQQAMATEAVECENGLVKGENYLGSRLMLQSRISLQLAFQNVDESCYAVYTYTDHYGKEQSVTVEGADFIDGYGVDIADISLADARQLVTCTVYDAEGEEVASVTDSVESYIARQSGDNALFDAIMKFATSAYNYFH